MRVVIRKPDTKATKRKVRRLQRTASTIHFLELAFG